MWVAHYAWLHSKYPKKKESRLSTITQDNPDSSLLEMPEVNMCQNLLEYLLDIGISGSSGFGLTPLTWTELLSWSTLTGITLTSWESLALMNLSRAFTSYHGKFDEKDVASPHVVEDFDRNLVSQSIGFRLRSLAKRMNK